MMEKMLNIALPKGRLGEKAYAMFEQAGFECPAIREEGRKLILDFLARTNTLTQRLYLELCYVRR